MLLIRFLLFLGLSVVLSNGDVSDNETQELLDWDPPLDFKQKFPYTLIGEDLDGSPVFFCEFGKWDMRGTVQQGPKQEAILKRYMDQALTRFKVAGNGTEGAMAVIDMDGYNLYQATHLPTVAFFLKFFRTIGDFFQSGGVKTILLINVNHIFFSIWEVGKPLLGSVAKDIELYGTNPAKWTPKILRLVAKDQLPHFLGGVKSHKPIQVFG